MKQAQVFISVDELKERDRLMETVLRGYCQRIPCEVVDRVVTIYHRYGVWAALEAAAAVVSLDITREVQRVREGTGHMFPT
jgi:hypothetical protein